METIYKYDLSLADEQKLMLPAGSEVLTIQQQGQDLYLWAKVNTDNPTSSITIVTCGTGNPLPQGDIKYISTVQLGCMVWHFFETTTYGVLDGKDTRLQGSSI